MILMIAEKYGRSPEEVENWEPYWLSRAALKIEGQGEHESSRRARRTTKTRR